MPRRSSRISRLDRKVEHYLHESSRAFASGHRGRGQRLNRRAATFKTARFSGASGFPVGKRGRASGLKGRYTALARSGRLRIR